MRILSLVGVMSIVIFAACTSKPIAAGAWTCQNNDVEISCNEKTCAAAAAGEFTPMSLSVDTMGSFSLCAYSGCWEGKAAKTSDSNDYFTASSAQLKWSGVTGGIGRVSVTIDMNTGTATLLGQGYAQPMICTAQ